MTVPSAAPNHTVGADLASAPRSSPLSAGHQSSGKQSGMWVAGAGVILLMLMVHLVMPAVPAVDKEPERSLPEKEHTEAKPAEPRQAAKKLVMKQIQLPAPPRLEASGQPPSKMNTQKVLATPGKTAAQKAPDTQISVSGPSAMEQQKHLEAIRAEKRKQMAATRKADPPPTVTREQPDNAKDRADDALGGVVDGTAASISKSAEADAGVLLRLLESGQGPDIRLLWPTAGRSRARLAAILTCKGMETAFAGPQGVVTAEGRLAAHKMDQFSGFMRATSDFTRAERRTLSTARRQLRATDRPATPVRLFPRALDRRLLAAFIEAGATTDGNSQMQARYQLNGRQLLLSDITVNGKKQPRPVEIIGPGDHCW